MTNPITKLSRKQRIIAVIFGLIVLIGVIGYGTILYINSRYDQKAADKIYTSGCDSNSISILKTAYSKAPRNSELKAKRAAEIGNCSAITKDLDGAEKWFRQASTDYKNNKNTKMSDQMKKIADNYALIKKIPEPTVPSGVTEEQKKQGSGIQ